MSHLNNEQFEDIIAGLVAEPKHMVDCERCRELLAERKALAGRLRSAFASVKPDEQLAKNIRAQLANDTTPKRVELVEHPQYIRLRQIAWPAVAAVLVIGTVFGVYLMRPASAMAAGAELAEIHKHNISTKHEFHSEADPKKLAKYFKSKLGFSPIMPQASQGLELRGCCIRHFRGQIVGSYVVETPQGVMSIVVVTDRPKSMGMERKSQQGEHNFWEGSFAKCNMVTLRLGDYSYCAVGEVSHKYLTELLHRLIPEAQ